MNLEIIRLGVVSLPLSRHYNVLLVKDRDMHIANYLGILSTQSLNIVIKSTVMYPRIYIHQATPV